jgi:protein involved in plasmid replication-relaxation
MTDHDETYNENITVLAAAPMKRLSRPQTPQPFRLTERDIDAVIAVAVHRFLFSHQIARLVGGSPRKMKYRLKHLWAHGYLDRPKNQRVYLSAFYDEGNLPLVYALGRRGAKLLAERGYPVDDKLDWTTKNTRPVPHTFAHTIETAETMIAIDLACRESGAAHLIDHHQLLPYLPPATRDLPDPFACKVSIPLNDLARYLPKIARTLREPLKITVVPDRVFTLLYPDNTRHNFALELDRGTMDIKSKSLLAKANVRKKIAGYFFASKQNLHNQLWGFQGMRVLIVTTSEARIRNMIAAQREVTGDTRGGLFLYSTLERLATHGPLGPAWITTTSDNFSFLPANKE